MKRDWVAVEEVGIFVQSLIDAGHTNIHIMHAHKDHVRYIEWKIVQETKG